MKSIAKLAEETGSTAKQVVTELLMDDIPLFSYFDGDELITNIEDDQNYSLRATGFMELSAKFKTRLTKNLQFDVNAKIKPEYQLSLNCLELTEDYDYHFKYIQDEFDYIHIERGKNKIQTFIETSSNEEKGRFSKKRAEFSVEELTTPKRELYEASEELEDIWMGKFCLEIIEPLTFSKQIESNIELRDLFFYPQHNGLLADDNFTQNQRLGLSRELQTDKLQKVISLFSYRICELASELESLQPISGINRENTPILDLIINQKLLKNIKGDRSNGQALTVDKLCALLSGRDFDSSYCEERFGKDTISKLLESVMADYSENWPQDKFRWGIIDHLKDK